MRLSLGVGDSMRTSLSGESKGPVRRLWRLRSPSQHWGWSDPALGPTAQLIHPGLAYAWNALLLFCSLSQHCAENPGSFSSSLQRSLTLLKEPLFKEDLIIEPLLKHWSRWSSWTIAGAQKDVFFWTIL